MEGGMGPMIDVYADEIAMALSSGNPKWIAEIAETFLTRCHYHRRWRIEAVQHHICPQDGLQILIAIRFSDGRPGEVRVGNFSGKRRLIVDSEVVSCESSASVVHSLGVPCCFFDGIYYAAECVHEDARDDIAEMTKACDREYITASSKLSQVQGSISWYERRLQETTSQFYSAKDALSDAIDRITVARSVDSVSIVPVDWNSRIGEALWSIQNQSPSFVSLCDAKNVLAGKSGIYFGWRVTDGKCVYVGKSKNLGSRLHGGRQELLDCKVSYIEMPEDQIHIWELFYIWLHRPERNSEVRKSADAVAACTVELSSDA